MGVTNLKKREREGRHFYMHICHKMYLKISSRAILSVLRASSALVWQNRARVPRIFNDNIQELAFKTKSLLARIFCSWSHFPLFSA